MLATLGDDLVATLIAPSVLPAYPMGARVEVPYTRAIVAFWREAVLDPTGNFWTVAFPVEQDALAAGEYQLVWRDSGPEPPELEVFIPLAIVSSTAGGVLPPGGPYPWAPTVEDVAEVTPAYTRGGFDDDRVDAGAEQEAAGIPTYTDDTDPDRAHVVGLITTACDEVAGRIGVAIPPSQYGLARTTAKWHVASVIEGGKQPANTDDASGAYRAAIANYRNNLDALVVIARAGTAPRLA